MRVLVIGRPRFQVPPEQMAGMAQGASAWLEKNRDSIVVSGAFVSGGGFAVLDVPDEQTMMRLMMEWPLTPVSDTQVELFIDAESGLQMLQEAMQGMGGGSK
jgi:hypothetical protein